jgi:hypothetical protein
MFCAAALTEQQEERRSRKSAEEQTEQQRRRQRQRAGSERSAGSAGSAGSASTTSRVSFRDAKASSSGSGSVGESPLKATPREARPRRRPREEQPTSPNELTLPHIERAHSNASSASWAPWHPNAPAGCSDSGDSGDGENGVMARWGPSPTAHHSVGLTFKFFSWAYLSRLALVIGMILVAGYCNALASAIAGYRTPQIQITAPSWAKGTQTLPDLGHDLIGPVLVYFTGSDHLDWFHLPDHFVTWSQRITSVFVACHPMRFVIFRRYIFIFASCLLFRTVSVLSTSLPDASPACQAQFGDPETGAYKEVPFEVAWPWAMRRAFMLMTEPGVHITCGDMVFSGHHTFVTCCLMTWVTYCQPHTCTALREGGCRWCRRIAHIVHGIALVCIIATKLHYTVDVIAANLLVVGVWRFYHHAVASERVKQQYALLQWIEAEEVLRIDTRAYNHWKEKGVLSEGLFAGYESATQKLFGGGGGSSSSSSSPPATPGERSTSTADDEVVLTSASSLASAAADAAGGGGGGGTSTKGKKAE